MQELEMREGKGKERRGMRKKKRRSCRGKKNRDVTSWVSNGNENIYNEEVRKQWRKGKIGERIEG